MEYSIDRSYYRRRENAEVEEVAKSKIMYKILKRLIIQSIAGVIILLVIYAIKIMKLQVAIDWIKSEVNKDIPISVAYDEVKSNLMKTYNKYFANMMDKQEKFSNSEEKNNELVANEIGQEVLPIEPLDTLDSSLEEAVEGVNQMSEDVSFINSNYKFIFPIKGVITSRFGVRNSDNPIITPYHSGTDIAANAGTKIYAAIGGKVVLSSTNESYGKHVMVQTDDVITLYAHCSKLCVNSGDIIKQGDIIGEVGSTGWATGPHLHFEIRYKDRFVDPAEILNFEE